MGRWRRRREDKRFRARDLLDCGDACEILDCLSVMSLRMVMAMLVGLWEPQAVDPHTAPPRGLGARIASRGVRAYQLHVSLPRGRPVCPMTPSCSRYGLQALSHHGLLHGGWLILRRLRRCGSTTATTDPVPVPR